MNHAKFTCCISLLLSAVIARPWSAGVAAAGERTGEFAQSRFQGRAFEVSLQPAPAGPTPYLFCFLPRRSFFALDATRTCVRTNDVTLHYDGQKFLVLLSTMPDWKIHGEFDGEKIAGTWDMGGSTVAFGGRQVDFDTYAFPLSADETIVAMRCIENSSGFLFEVVAPPQFQKMRVGAHHDPDLGPTSDIAVPGCYYLWRARRSWIGDESGTICSAYLANMLRVGRDPLDPRYRPAAELYAAVSSQRNANK